MWALVGKATLSVTGLLVNVILTRLLAPEEIGAYFIISSILAVAGVFILLGLDMAVVRLIAESMAIGQPGRSRQAIQWALTFLSIGCLLGVGLMLLGGGRWITERIFHSSLLGNLIGLVTLWMVLSTFQTLLAEIFRGFHDIRLAAVLSGGGALTRFFLFIFVTIIWFWQGISNLRQVILLSIAANAITVSFVALMLMRRLSKLPAAEGIMPREIVAVTWPFWVNSIGMLILNQADVWILGNVQAAKSSSHLWCYMEIGNVDIDAYFGHQCFYSSIDCRTFCKK